MALNFSSDTPPQVVSLSSSAQVLNLSAYSFICWFKAASSATYRYIYTQEANYNEQMFVRLNNTGTLNFWHRTPSAIVDITSSGTYDNGNWHWLLLLRRGNADFQAYVDGSSIGTSANNPGTISVSPTVVLGDYISGDEPLRGDLARCILFTNAIEVEEAGGIAYSGRSRFTARFWHEFNIGGATVSDWSSNQYTGTVTGATIADHPPIAFPFASIGMPITILTPASQNSSVNLANASSTGLSLSANYIQSINSANASAIGNNLTTLYIQGLNLANATSSGNNLTTAVGNVNASVDLSNANSTGLSLDTNYIQAVNIANALSSGYVLDTSVGTISIGVNLSDATGLGYDVNATSGVISNVNSSNASATGYDISTSVGPISVTVDLSNANALGYDLLTQYYASLGIANASATGLDLSASLAGTVALVGQALASSTGYSTSFLTGAISVAVQKANASAIGYIATSGAFVIILSVDRTHTPNSYDRIYIPDETRIYVINNYNRIFTPDN